MWSEFAFKLSLEICIAHDHERLEVPHATIMFAFIFPMP
jgi:hypothetical protein